MAAWVPVPATARRVQAAREDLAHPLVAEQVLVSSGRFGPLHPLVCCEVIHLRTSGLTISNNDYNDYNIL